MNLLILLFLILYIGLAVIRLEWAVLLILAALPVYLIRGQILGIPFTLLEAMILVSFFVWFITKTEFRNFIRGKYGWKNFKDNKTKRLTYPFGLEIILLLIISFMAVAISGFSDAALGVWKAYFFEPVLFFMLMLNVFVGSGNSNCGDKKNQTTPSPSSSEEGNYGKKIYDKTGKIKNQITHSSSLPTGRQAYIRRGDGLSGNGNGCRLEKILWALSASALLVAVLAIYQQITGNLIFNEFWADPANRRVVSFFGYPNAVGLYLGPLILVFSGLLINLISDFKNKKITNYPSLDKRSGAGKLSPPQRDPAHINYNKVAGQITNKLQISNIKLQIVFLSIIVIISTLSIYFAKSKGALVGVIVGLIVFALLAGGRKIRWTAIVLILIAVIGISAYAPLHSYTLDKTIYSKSIQIRQAGWQETWTMFKDGRIISGAGLANYQQTIVPYHQEGVFIEDYRDAAWLNKIRASAEFRQQNWQPLEIYLYPHNIFLNFWSELGLAGMLLFAWIIFKYLAIGFKIYDLRIKNNKYIVLGLIGAMVVIIVHGLVDVPYFKNDLAVMFWVFVALMSILNLGSRKTRN